LDKTLILSTDFRKKVEYRLSSKPVQWELSCSMQTDDYDDGGGGGGGGLLSMRVP
jgi:hypothetical protein